MVTQIFSFFAYVLTQPLLLRLTIAAVVVVAFGAMVLLAKAAKNPLRFFQRAGASISRRTAIPLSGQH